MYSFSVDESNIEQWQRQSSEFSGNSIYQSWLYGELHSTGLGRACSRVSILRDSRVVAKAQLRLKRLPFTSYGVAEVDWGPLWHHDGATPDYSGIEALLDSLRSEYTEKRGLQLRIRPTSTLFPEKDAELQACFLRQGFMLNNTVRPYYTVVIDLSDSLDEIRANLHQKWRNQLNAAERADLTYDYGSSAEHFRRFYTIYKAMWNQKKFPTGVRLPTIEKLHARLPENERFMITIVRDGDADIGATVCSAMGNTLLYFLGATLPGCREESRPGYLLQWLHIQKGQELGLRWYDLGGYNDNVQAIARFKKRTNGRQVIFPGQFETLSTGFQSKAFSFADRAYQAVRRRLPGT